MWIALNFMDLPSYVLIKSKTLMPFLRCSVRRRGLFAGKGYTQAASFYISGIILAYEMANLADSLYSLAALLFFHVCPPLAKAICFFRQKLSSATPPFSPSLFFIPVPFFFFCPSSICHLDFAATIFCPLSGLPSITRVPPAFLSFYHI